MSHRGGNKKRGIRVAGLGARVDGGASDMVKREEGKASKSRCLGVILTHTPASATVLTKGFRSNLKAF